MAVSGIICPQFYSPSTHLVPQTGISATQTRSVVYVVKQTTGITATIIQFSGCSSFVFIAYADNSENSGYQPFGQIETNTTLSQIKPPRFD